MRKTFFTETLQEPLIVVFFGEETPFLQGLVSAISKMNPQFVGKTYQEVSRESLITPYLLVGVIEVFQKEKYDSYKFNLRKGQKEWGSPISLILPSTLSESQQEGIQKDFPQAFVLVASDFLLSENNMHSFGEKILNNRGKAGIEGLFIQQTKQSFSPKSPPASEEKKTDSHTLFSHLPVERVVQKSPRGSKRRVVIPPSQPEKLLKSYKTPVVLVPPPETSQVERVLKQREEEVLKTLFPTRQAPQTILESKPKLSLPQPEVHSLITPSVSRKKVPTWIKWGSVAGISLLVGVIFSFALFIYMKKSLTSSVINLQKSLTSSTISVKVEQERKYLRWNMEVMGGLQYLARPFSFITSISRFLDETDHIISLDQKEVLATQAIEDFSKKSIEIYKTVVSSQSNPGENIRSLTVSALSQAGEAEKQLSLLAAELSREVGITLSLPLANTEFRQNLATLRKDFLEMEHFLPILPNVLGEEKKKTYLVLIQNPLELRPTGGFLGSYALLTFDKGQLLDVQVQDSYTADALLKGKVDPPQDLARYLGEKQWYFRDTNWSADFPTVARQAEWFIEKETGIVVDGTLGINAYTLARLLEATGPVQLPSYNNESVSAENILERIQLHSELTLTLTGEKRKEYLSVLTEAIFTAAKNLSEEQALRLGKALLQSTETSDLLISLKSQEDDNIIRVLGWGGQVMTPPCPQQFSDIPCIVDTAFQVDTNVGVNRANYYLKRSLNHSVILTPTTAAHIHTMHITNAAPSSAWPAGPYKNYVRLFIPREAQLNSVTVNDRPLPRDEISQGSEFEKKVVGFYLEIPVGQTMNVVVNYVTPLTQQQHFSYALFFQKQPGSEVYPATLSLQVQRPLEMLKAAPNVSVSEGILQLDTTIDHHQYMAVELKQ